MVTGFIVYYMLNNILLLFLQKVFSLFTVVCLIIQEGKYLFGKWLDSLAIKGVTPTVSGHYPFHDGENLLLSQVRLRPGEVLPYNQHVG